MYIIIGILLQKDFHQTGAVTNGIIKETLFEPDWSKCEMVYTGPQIFVANPLYKTSRTTTRSKADFDTINLNDIPDNLLLKGSKFKPILNLTDYKNIIPSFDIERKVRAK